MNNNAMPVSSALIRSRKISANTAVRMPPHELHQSGADEVAHAFDVGHDARDQHAGLVGIVVRDRQPADMFLHFAAQFRDQALRFLREQLGQRKGGGALDHGRGEHRQDERLQQPDLAMADDVVDQVTRRGRQHQPGGAVDQHQEESDGEQLAPRPHQFLQQRQNAAEVIGRFPLRVWWETLSPGYYFRGWRITVRALPFRAGSRPLLSGSTRQFAGNGTTTVVITLTGRPFSSVG